VSNPLDRLIAAVRAVVEYGATGGPTYCEWDAKYDALAEALAAYDAQPSASAPEPQR